MTPGQIPEKGQQSSFCRIFRGRNLPAGFLLFYFRSVGKGGTNMATRESRRIKEKRSVVPFGDIMLPVIGLVAVGLLIVGVKMFFLSGDKSSSYNPPVARTIPAAPQKAPVKEVVPVPVPVQPSPPAAQKAEGKGDVALAVPAGSSGEASPAVQGESPIASPPESKPEGTAKKTQPKKHPVSVQKPATPPTTPSMKDSRWGVQIGAFTSKESAESVRKQASKSGYSTALTKAVVQGKTYYRVTVPAGKDRPSAVSLSEKIKNAGYPVLVVEVR